MSPNWNKLTPAVGLSVVLLILAPRVAAAQLIWGLGENNHLYVFAPSDPFDIVAEADITGLAPGETIRAIDFRPRYDQLYGYGSTHRLYRINPVTGKATAIGGGVPLAITVDSTAEMGFDFERQRAAFAKSRRRHRHRAAWRERRAAVLARCSDQSAL